MSSSAPYKQFKALFESLGSLEEVLEPLLAKPLAETLQDLDVLENAKLDVSLAYIIQDLVWMYLKVKGLTPKNHPVARELERIHPYFQKLKDAEKPPKRTLAVDKAAAGRFIKAALAAAAAAQEEEAGNQPDPEPSSSVGTHNNRFQWAARKPSPVDDDTKEDVKMEGDTDEDDEEESELEMYDEEPAKVDKGKGRARDSDSPPEDAAGPPAAIPEPVPPSGLRRPRIDPFAGYGDDVVEGQPANKKRRKKKTHAQAE